ncbi:PTS sugar transporter subunit IIA [Allonocardiopsis opalescens]|uniref:Mannitol-specific phosphotransferase enzyme IIA component n=1 Tax=Allonocardiopsis opalescens TaxID=1144618 RepID=A0A2T0QEE1_9ACTN|nr:PTS sugar transporter subunit IIA [Allonocardiopsis opalescens]PRY02250.1 PTS system IIA component (Fru family) [Allonocardiopsis opalescens]
MRTEPTGPGVLAAEAIRLGLSAADQADAIAQCGRVLLEIGAVEEPYPATMHERERSVSTFVGEGIAIPHGTDAGRAYVRRTALAVLQFPAGVDWGGNDVRLCVAIAASGDEHVGVLAALANALLEPGVARSLREAADPEAVLAVLRVEPS